MKRFFLLAIYLLFTTVPSYSYDYNHWDFEVDNIRYRVLSDNTCTVVSLTKVPSGYTLTIPSRVTTKKGKTLYVTEIYCLDRFLSMEEKRQLRKITRVNLPRNLHKIDGGVFREFKYLTSIDLPSSLYVIGAYAFDSSGLASITLPEGLESIEEGAFQQCSFLTAITIPSSCLRIGKNVFYYCRNLKKIDVAYSNKPLILLKGACGVFSWAESVIIRREIKNSDQWRLRFGNQNVTFELIENVEFDMSHPTDAGVYTFGEQTRSVVIHPVAGSYVSEIRLLTGTPPATNRLPNSFYLNTKLIVPQGSLSAYQNAPGWKEFFTIEESKTVKVNAPQQRQPRQQQQEHAVTEKHEYRMTVFFDPSVDALPAMDEILKEGEKPDTMPKFNGCDAGEFANWVYSVLEYPQESKDDGIQGRVRIKFTVATDGSVKDVSVIRGVSEAIDAEAVRVVSSSPKWIPATKDGQRIPFTYEFPVIFQLR